MMDEVRNSSDCLINEMLIKEMGCLFTLRSWEGRASSSLWPKAWAPQLSCSACGAGRRQSTALGTRQPSLVALLMCNNSRCWQNQRTKHQAPGLQGCWGWLGWDTGKISHPTTADSFFNIVLLYMFVFFLFKKKKKRLTMTPKPTTLERSLHP